MFINSSSPVSSERFHKIWSFEQNYIDPFNTVQSKPKEFEGKLFLVDGLGNLIVLDKNSGQLVYKTFIGPGAGRRGFTIDKDKKQLAILAGSELYILDIKSGKKLNSVETTKSVTAPIITRDCYIVFGSRGVVQCHNKKLDKIRWKSNLGKTARVWSNAIWSNKHNMVYFVTSNPGGLVAENRPKDTYSSSLIGLDASTGLVKFAHQMVKNDLWDYDGVGQPIFIENFDVTNGDKYDLVIGLNKTGTVFAVHARTGLPIKKGQFVERIFPEVITDLVDSRSSQTIPSWPDRVSSIELYEKDLRIDQIKPELLRYAKFGEFVPPSVNYDTVIKGLHGGPEWHGGVYFDDVVNNKKLLAVPVNNTSWILRVKYIYRPAIFGHVKNIVDFFKIYIFKPFKTYISKPVMNALRNNNKNESATKPKKQDTRWIQTVWTDRGLESKISDAYFKYMGFKYANKTYKENCASCHRYDRNGKYQSELVGDGYIPSLVGYTLTDKFDYGGNYFNFQKLHKSKVEITENELNGLFEHFDAIDKKALEEGKLKKKGFWQILLGKDSLPLNKSPWGGIAIVDLKSGKLVNHITVGKMKNKNGQIKDSSVIFGGLGSVNKKGRTMLTGTVDANAYYVSLPEGKIIDTVKLMRPGSVNPVLTEINGCEAWVFIETGGRFSFYERNLNGFSVEAFVNKNTC
jgi:glucose dehydrogenase